MSLRLLVSGGLVFAVLLTMATVVAPQAEASHLSDPTRCTCSSSLSFDRPSLRWSSEGLIFTPRVNFSVRARGGDQAPPLSISVNYEGGSAYASEDVSPPNGVSFSGEKQLLSNFPCNGSYRAKGVELSDVTLSGLLRSLLGEDQELEGNVQMKASIAGCGFEEENRQFSFRLREFGNLRVGSWHSVR